MKPCEKLRSFQSERERPIFVSRLKLVEESAWIVAERRGKARPYTRVRSLICPSPLQQKPPSDDSSLHFSTGLLFVQRPFGQRVHCARLRQRRGSFNRSQLDPNEADYRSYILRPIALGAYLNICTPGLFQPDGGSARGRGSR